MSKKPKWKLMQESRERRGLLLFALTGYKTPEQLARAVVNGEVEVVTGKTAVSKNN